ncbi:MAG: cytochrome b/b6 domain-containing protein [Bacteroidales bacterium]|nr:cytochrome b/b6 domain-containing protein [Bacteroidales bacterium]MCF8405150.1 cytochrome b/b6 domain-containing protein [Bacteroidales bacterium]
MTKKVYLYKRFERFWHWSQTILIFALTFTGFEIHGVSNFIGYENAVVWHNNAAWAFIILIIFAIFWHLTTDEWRNYIPTVNNFKAQVNYYLTGIFRHAPHPTKKLTLSKLNPLQRLVYFGLKILLIPLMVASGLLYMYFHYPLQGIELDSLKYIAILHTLGAYLLISFVIIHLYLITTGRTLTSNLNAMITGWDEMEEDEIKGIVIEAVDGAGLRIRSEKGDEKSRAEVKSILVNALKETEYKVMEDDMEGQKKEIKRKK